MAGREDITPDESVHELVEEDMAAEEPLDAEVAEVLEVEPAPEPPPCFVPIEPEEIVTVEPAPEPPVPTTIVKTCAEYEYEAFCAGVQAMVRMTRVKCNQGHMRQMAKKAGYVPPEE